MTSYPKLERFEREVAAAKAVQKEAEAKRDLRRVIREVIPKSVRKAMPKRPRGRSAVGGLSRREVLALREQAATYLDGARGLAKLEADIQHQVLVILLIDGVLGTEPWRAAGGAHGGLIAANARLRYLENATRLLEDLRRSREAGESGSKLLEGVIDAEVTR